MELLELKTRIRKKSGDGPARALRRKGQVPAILYGPGKDPVSLSFCAHDFELLIKNKNTSQTVFNLNIEEGSSSSLSAMIKEIQSDFLSKSILHVDFYQIDMDRKIKVKVPVIPKGKSIGVELGGMLQMIRREVEVLCLPNEIPKSIEVDVTNLNIGDSIHVKGIPLEGNVELPPDVNFTVATIIGKKAGGTDEGEETGMEESEDESSDK